jgi:hypothetical protein
MPNPLFDLCIWNQGSGRNRPQETQVCRRVHDCQIQNCDPVLRRVGRCPASIRTGSRQSKGRRKYSSKFRSWENDSGDEQPRSHSAGAGDGWRRVHRGEWWWTWRPSAQSATLGRELTKCWPGTLAAERPIRRYRCGRPSQIAFATFCEVLASILRSTLRSSQMKRLQHVPFQSQQRT